MARHPPLNARQLEVLRWIADGCPDGVMEDFTHKTTALALQNRHLAAVRKRRGAWSAEVTDEGRYYLAHGRYEPTKVQIVATGEAVQADDDRPKADLAVRAPLRRLSSSTIVNPQVTTASATPCSTS